MRLTELEKVYVLEALEYSLDHMKNSPSGDGSPYTDKMKWESIKILMGLIEKITTPITRQRGSK